MFLHSLMCISDSLWCPSLTIREMTTINEITAKIDHVLFTWIAFSGCEKWLTHACPSRKVALKISQNFGKCDEVCVHKRIISITGEYALKKCSAVIFFLYWNIDQLKQGTLLLKLPLFRTLKISIPRKYLLHLWVGRDFYFDL